MKRILLVLVSFGLCFSLFAQEQSSNKTDSITMLVVTGGPAFRHQVDLVPTSFYTLFMGYDNLFWDHATYDEAAFQTKELSTYDVILMYNRSDSLSEESEEKLKTYLESGKGLIVLHHALGSYNYWEWWWKDVVGGKYQMIESSNFPKSDYKLGEQINMIPQKDHAITNAIKSFSFVDETYKDLWISNEVEILYRTDNLNSDGPTMWISPYKKSNVVVIQPGHAKTAHLNETYKDLIYQTILWACNNE